MTTMPDAVELMERVGYPEVLIDEEPTEETRYGVYELGYRPGEATQGPVRVAETSREGIGGCLVQLADDRREAGDPITPIVGVLDQIERRWITSLWPQRR